MEPLRTAGNGNDVGDIEMGMGMMGDMPDVSAIPMSMSMGMGMSMSMNFGEIAEIDNALINAPATLPASKAAEQAAARRRRDVRTARDKLGEQFEELKCVLPRAKRNNGSELTAKSQILEHSLVVLRQLMTRATTLAVELAVVSPEATHRWVQDVSDDGRRPIAHTVAAVMKLFCWSRRWQYAEWWTLDETSSVEHGDIESMKRNGRDEKEGSGANENGDNATGNSTTSGSSNGNGNEEMGTMAALNEPSPDNVQACVIRDCVSVMKLSRTLINVKSCTRDLSEFARISKDFQFRPRIGMPGRVWSSRRAEWLPTLGDADSFRRSSLALKFGMKTCLAVPVMLGGQVHSVMAFYAQSSRPFNSKCHDLATTLSESLANIYSPHPSSGWDVSFQRML